MDSFLLAFLPKSSMNSSSPHSSYLHYPSHPHWLDYSNCTCRSVYVMTLLIMQFSRVCHLIPLTSKYSHHPVLTNILCLCSPLNVRDQVSHPYRTTGKIRVLCILIFTFYSSVEWRVTCWVAWVRFPAVQGFSPPQRPDRLWGTPSLLFRGQRGLFLPRGWSGRDVKLRTHLHLVPRSRNVELYLHFPIRHGIVLN
jgi:hypothetical protein